MAVMSELHQQVLAALLTIRKDGPKEEYFGICMNVDTLLSDEICADDVVNDLLEGLFVDWPDKSHSDTYPIGNWVSRPSSLFWAHHDTNRSMWDRDTRYGKARWDLLDHCITKLGSM